MTTLPSPQELHAMHINGGGQLTYAQIGAIYGVSGQTIRGRVRRAGHAAQSEIERLKAEIERLKTGMYEPSARDDTDWPQWLEHVQRYKRLPRMLKVALCFDLHFPDEDARAVELFLRMNATVKPDLVIVGGDQFDFDVLSMKYPRMYTRRARDPFEEVRTAWDAFVSQVKMGAPDAQIVVIGDNHAQGRIEAYINEKAAEFGDFITAGYNDLVRSNNRVLWLGWTQEVRIGPLLIEHGKTTGENAAKNALKKRGWASPSARGHGHRKLHFINTIEYTADDGTSAARYPVESIMVGCLCNVLPHYQTDSKASDWNQGAAIAHVNMHGQDVHFQNVLFHPRRDGSLACVLGEKEFVALPERKRQRRTA